MNFYDVLHLRMRLSDAAASKTIRADQIRIVKMSATVSLETLVQEVETTE